MRRIIGIATACGALTITALVPASAETLASQEVADAYSTMMTVANVGGIKPWAFALTATQSNARSNLSGESQ